MRSSFSHQGGLRGCMPGCASLDPLKGEECRMCPASFLRTVCLNVRTAFSGSCEVKFFNPHDLPGPMCEQPSMKVSCGGLSKCWVGCFYVSSSVTPLGSACTPFPNLFHKETSSGRLKYLPKANQAG